MEPGEPSQASSSRTPLRRQREEPARAPRTPRPETMATLRELEVQDRLESGPIGRAVISGFLLVTLTCLVALNLPQSRLRETLDRVAAPYSRALGVDQSWSLFAPDPRTAIVEPSARVTFADGSTAVWPGVSAGGPGLDEYATSRWQKWAEWLTQERYATLWQPAAQWVARRYAATGRRPVRVELLRAISPLPPPGRAALGTEVDTYYALDLGPTP